MNPRELEFVLHADIRAIPGLVARLERFGRDHRVPEEAIFKVQLVLDELINNAIDHGYPGRSPGEIRVRVTRDEDRIDILLSDDAVLFNPFKAPQPKLDATIEDRPLGGLGVHLVRRLTRDARYAVVDGRNSVHVSVSLRDES